MALSKRFGWKYLLLVLVVVVIVAVLGFAQFVRNSQPVFIDKTGKEVVPSATNIPKEYADAVARLYEENNLPTEHLAARLEAVGQFPAELDEFAFVDGLSRVFLRDKVYYLDKAGVTVIKVSPAVYAEHFSEGLAAVATKREPSKDTFNISSGEPAITLTGWGFIDKSGNFVVPPSFDLAASFSEGLAMVEVDGKRGYIDKSGVFVINPQYRFACSFSEGLAAVEKGGKWGFIDKSGTFIIPPRFWFAMSFSEGLAPVGDDAAGASNNCGFIDKTGNFVISPSFCNAAPFSDGFAAVSVGDPAHSQWGYIDRSGKIQIKPRYMMAEPFKDGKALVWSGSWFWDLYSWLTYRNTYYTSAEQS